MGLNIFKPGPGMVVVCGGTRHRVLRRTIKHVEYETLYGTNGKTKPETIDIAYWREWCRRNEVRLVLPCHDPAAQRVN